VSIAERGRGKVCHKGSLGLTLTPAQSEEGGGKLPAYKLKKKRADSCGERGNDGQELIQGRGEAPLAISWYNI